MSAKMMRVAIAIFCASVTGCAWASGSYKAAAVEFAPDLASPNSSVETIAEVKKHNVDRLAAFAKSAKAQGAQIIVMPEYGITGDGVQNVDFTRQTVVAFLEETPINITNPCLHGGSLTSSPSIVKLSCVARALEMVIVFDLLTKTACNGGDCPSDGLLIHNTAFAVGEDGALLSTYHKRHPFGDETKYLDASTNTTKSRFTTKFGVTFGMFICFDIVWELSDPDVHDIVFPTDWVNGALAGFGPSARQAQIAWSGLHQKNLIAANYGGFAKDSSGSGIYRSGHTLTSYFNPTTQPRSKLLIADVPIGKDQTSSGRLLMDHVAYV